MTEVTVPPESQGERFDFGRSFAFVFEDPDWLNKILLGGLFYLLGVVIVGWFIVFGYLAALARNVIAGVERPLPEWSGIGDYFAEGLKLFAVGLVYLLPNFLLALMWFGLSVLFDASDSWRVSGPFAMVLLALFSVPIVLIVYVTMPAALIRVVVTRRFSAAFEFGRVWDLIRFNAINYLLTIATYIIASFVGQLGFLLCCIGVFFTSFWGLVVTTHAMAQTYRYSSVK
ncbi:MAG: DUF4013 domain-containing protein [Thermoanaerobaculia bacterium]